MSLLALIVPLFSRSRPPAVAGRISKLIVYPVDGFSHRPLAHVRKKVLKFSPSLADFDAATAVMLVSMIFLVVAAGNHPPPTGVGWSEAAIGAMSVRETGFAIFFGEASTGLCETSRQVLSVDDGFVAAIAPTKPPRVGVLGFRLSYSDQSTKPLSSDIYQLAHSHLPGRQT